MAGVFISYRRQDGGGWANHLAHDLRDQFGSERVFMDIDAIEAGVDFVKEITRAVASSEALLAMIGPHWLSAADSSGARRLDNPKDFIPLEIAIALSRDIRVIPLLVGGARIPRPEDLPDDIRALSHRHAYELTDKRWKIDVHQLVAILEKVLRRPLAKSPAQKNAGCEKADPAAGMVSDLEKIFDKPRHVRASAQENAPREQEVDGPQNGRNNDTTRAGEPTR